MLKYIKIAFRNVLLNKRRSAFIIFAVAIGTMIMILTFSLSNGVRETMITNSLARYTGHINIYGTQNVRGRNINKIFEFNKIDKIIKDVLVETFDNNANSESDENFSLQYITSFTGDVYDFNKSIRPQRSTLLGINLDEQDLFKQSVIVLDGDIESINQNGNAIIDDNTASRFRLKVGDNFQFQGLVNTEEWGVVYNTVDLRVGAIVQSLNTGRQIPDVRINNDTARTFSMDKSLDYSTIRIYLNNNLDTDINKLKTKIMEVITEKGYTITERRVMALPTTGTGTTTAGATSGMTPSGGMGGGGGAGGFRGSRSQDITNSMRITTWVEETAYLEQMVRTLDNVSYFLNIILMAIILIGISNALVISIRERTAEIGTVRAIGMKSSSVMLMFILEGLILGLIGSIIGIIVGGGLSALFSFVGIPLGQSNLSVFLINNSLYLKLNLIQLLMVVGIVIVVSMFGSLQPSYRASKLSPIIAINKD